LVVLREPAQLSPPCIDDRGTAIVVLLRDGEPPFLDRSIKVLLRRFEHFAVFKKRMSHRVQSDVCRLCVPDPMKKRGQFHGWIYVQRVAIGGVGENLKGVALVPAGKKSARIAGKVECCRQVRAKGLERLDAVVEAPGSERNRGGHLTGEFMAAHCFVRWSPN